MSFRASILVILAFVTGCPRPETSDAADQTPHSDDSPVVIDEGTEGPAEPAPDTAPPIVEDTAEEPVVEAPTELCGDGIDNDGDVYVDCADSDCVANAACLCNAPQPSGPEFGAAACTDGIDNDCDGKADGDDKDCNASDYYATEFCNGIDDNGNNIIDDFSCRCAKSSECGPGQICYTQSSRSCGPPCNLFVGDVCPFVAPGSICSPATGQCVFP